MQVNLSLRLSHTVRRSCCVRRSYAGFFWCYCPSCRVALRGNHGQGHLPWAKLVLGKDISSGLGQLSTPKTSKTWKAQTSLVISCLFVNYFKGSLLPSTNVFPLSLYVKTCGLRRFWTMVVLDQIMTMASESLSEKNP